MSSFKDKTLLLAHSISEYLNSQGIDIWLEYGSALGAVREGGVINGDLDIDFGIWWKDWGRFRQLVLDSHKSNTESFYKIGSSIPFSFDFRTFPVFDYKPFPLGGEVCKIKVLDPSVEVSVDKQAYSDSLYLDIYCFKEHNSIKSSPVCYESSYRSKSYYQKNLKKIQFEGLDFYVSKYAEKYLDYIYKDAGGEGVTWRTPVKREDVVDWEHSLYSSNTEDPVSGCIEGVFDLFHIGHVRIFQKMREAFDTTIAAITPDEVVKTYKNAPIIPFNERVEMIKSCKYIDKVIAAPPGSVATIEWMENNNVDYVVHGEATEEFVEKWYSDAVKEHRFITFPETPDRHTSSLRKKIYKSNGSG
jgi:cytidyltransferase-like protein